MNIIKKRFGYINMTNELPSGVEETVFSFEKQIENLTEENERLKIKNQYGRQYPIKASKKRTTTYHNAKSMDILHKLGFFYHHG